VRQACHGARTLSKEERRKAYREGVDRNPSYAGAEYVNVDTQFQVGR